MAPDAAACAGDEKGLDGWQHSEMFRAIALLSSRTTTQNIHNINIRYSSLIGGLEHFLFSHILGIIIPIDFHIFQRGGPTTNQQIFIRYVNQHQIFIRYWWYYVILVRYWSQTSPLKNTPTPRAQQPMTSQSLCAGARSERPGTDIFIYNHIQPCTTTIYNHMYLYHIVYHCISHIYILFIIVYHIYVHILSYFISIYITYCISRNITWCITTHMAMVSYLAFLDVSYLQLQLLLACEQDDRGGTGARLEKTGALVKKGLIGSWYNWV